MLELIDAESIEAPSPTSGVSSDQIADMLAQITHNISNKVKSEIANSEANLKALHRLDHKELSERMSALTATITARVDDALTQINSTRQISIKLVPPLGVPTTLPIAHRHPKFETLLRIACSRQPDGFHPNIWIAGPAGSGKTTGGRQLAEALSLPFYFNGAVNMEHKLIGYEDATGRYHTTPFREGFTSPAIYQFDDVDSSDNAALIPLNAATANGLCDFPDLPTPLPRHPDSIIIATANTWGLGATSDYVGRVKLDAAFLSRFPAKLFWDYDEPFEISISGNPSWAKRVQRARKRARELGLKVIMDPRLTYAGAGMLASGNFPNENEVAELTYLANLNPDQRKQVELI